MKEPIITGYGILVIDNNEEQLQVFTDALQRIRGQYTFRNANDILLAFKMIRRQSPNFIFINYDLSLVNALHLLAVLQAQRKLSRIKVYLYAEHISEGVNKMARMLGASGCIEKTKSPETFLRELKAILNPELLPRYIFFNRSNGSLKTGGETTP